MDAEYLHGSIPFPPMEAELVRDLPEGDGSLDLLDGFEDNPAYGLWEVEPA